MVLEAWKFKIERLANRLMAAGRRAREGDREGGGDGGREGKNQPKCPSVIDWIKKMCYIYTMEYYAAIKKDEFMSFAGTWIKLETIILSHLIQE